MREKRKHRKPFFENKICDICKSPAIMFRVIKDKTYMLCGSRKCDFETRIRNGWHKPILRK